MPADCSAIDFSYTHKTLAHSFAHTLHAHLHTHLHTCYTFVVHSFQLAHTCGTLICPLVCTFAHSLLTPCTLVCTLTCSLIVYSFAHSFAHLLHTHSTFHRLTLDCSWLLSDCSVLDCYAHGSAGMSTQDCIF